MKHYTTIEQSKKLLELGLNPETADMTYCAVVEGTMDKTSIKGWEVITGTKKWEVSVNAIKNNSFSYRNGYIVPCWSLGALLEIMPEQIIYSDFKPFPLGLFKGNKEEHSKYGHYWIQYFATDSGGAYVQTNGHSPIEAAFNMVVWLLENGFIKKS